MSEYNATYIYFSRAGKFKEKVRGMFPLASFLGYYRGAEAAREDIQTANAGRMPGLVTSGRSYTVVVIPDESLDVGWPIILPPVEG